MELLPEGRMRVHPEVVEKFNELVRHHFQAYRRGKEAADIRKDMRIRDTKEQAALLTGKCEAEIKLTHQRDCNVVFYGPYYNLPCNCQPTKEVIFKEQKKEDQALRADYLRAFNDRRGFYGL